MSPEELIRATKPVTQATARAVAAGNSCRQDDVIAAANSGRKAIGDMLTACKVRRGAGTDRLGVRPASPCPPYPGELLGGRWKMMT